MFKFYKSVSVVALSIVLALSLSALNTSCQVADSGVNCADDCVNTVCDGLTGAWNAVGKLLGLICDPYCKVYFKFSTPGLDLTGKVCDQSTFGGSVAFVGGSGTKYWVYQNGEEYPVDHNGKAQERTLSPCIPVSDIKGGHPDIGTLTGDLLINDGACGPGKCHKYAPSSSITYQFHSDDCSLEIDQEIKPRNIGGGGPLCGDCTCP